MLLHEENNLDCKIPRKEFIGRNMLGKFLENSGRFLESSPEEKLYLEETPGDGDAGETQIKEHGIQ